VVVWTGDADSGGVNAVAPCRIGTTRPAARGSESSKLPGRCVCFVGTGKGSILAIDITQDVDARLDAEPCASPVRGCQHVGEHSGFVSCTLPVGNLIFTGSVDGSIRCYRLNSDNSTEPIAGHQDHEGPVHRLAFDSSTAKLFSASSDCTLRAWDLRSSAASSGRKVLCAFECEVHSCECFPGADCIACGLENGSIFFVKPSTGEILREMKGRHDGIVTSMQKALLSKSHLLEYGKAEWTSRNVRGSSIEGVTVEIQEVLDIIPFEPLKESIVSALVDDDKEVLLELSRGFPNSIKVTIEDIKKRTVQQGVWGPKTEEEADTVSSKCDTAAPILLTTSRDGTTKVWNVRSGQCLVTVGQPGSLTSTQKGKANRIYCTLPAAGGKAFLTAGTDGVISRWNVRTGALEHEYHGHASTIFCLAQDSESGCLISCSSDRTVRVWCPAAQCEFCPLWCSCGEGCRTHELKIIPPGPPLNVETAARDASAGVAWAAPIDDGNASILHYEVYADRQSDGSRTGNALKVDGAETSCTLGGLENGTAYTVSVVAVNCQGKGVAAVGSHAVTPVAPPAAPTDLSCELDVLTGVLRLTWTATPEDKSGGSAILDYIVHYERDICEDHAGDTAGRLSVGPATVCELPGADKPGLSEVFTAGQTYKFTVTAVNAAGESLESNRCVGAPALPKCLPTTPPSRQSSKLHDTSKVNGVHSNFGVDESIEKKSMSKRHSLPRLTKGDGKTSGPKSALRASLRSPKPVNASNAVRPEAAQRRSNSSSRGSSPAAIRSTSLPRLGPR